MPNHIAPFFLAACLILGLGQAVPAAGPAAAPTTGHDDMFATMDANKDSALTKEEFTAHGMEGDFATYDQNGDGKVTRSEFDAVDATKGGKMPGM